MPARTGLLAGASVLAALLSAGPANAATVTVTNDAGQPAQLSAGSALRIRHMAPVVTPAFSAAEKRYSLVITGPDGKSAALEAKCASAEGAGPRDITYAGNGTYAVELVTWADADDIFCDGPPTTHSFGFVIAASVTLTGPSSPQLYRQIDKGQQDFTFHYDLNPGADDYNFAWAYDAQFGANGAIVGEYPYGDYGEDRVGIPDGTNDELRFPHPGTVSVVAAAKAGLGTISPFSAPVTLKLMGPFDWSSRPGFTGGRGRTHVIGGEVYEPAMVGHKVSVLLAKRGGKFKRFVTRTIPPSRKLSFKIKKPRGKYRLKYVFKGSELVAGGAWVQNLKIGRAKSASLGKPTQARG